MNFKRFAILASLICFFLLRSQAAELVLPAPAMERQGLITVLYRTSLQATGTGELHLQWTDVYGRLVDDRTLAVELTDENEFRFQLDMSRAVAMQNKLQAHFTFKGVNKKGEPDIRTEDAAVSFVAKPRNKTWSDYTIIMWQDGSAQHFKELQKVGVNAGKSSEHSMALPESLLQDDLPWYVENIATDFYSEYHRYRPDRPYDWSLMQAKALYKRDPQSNEGLKRNPSFSDPHWLSMIHDRLVQAAEVYSPYRPIFYNLADETGIAELAGFWDFDFSDHSLAAMRYWLQERYGALAALNRQWDTHFETWNAVIPDTTREAMKRGNDNFSSWADGKEWMDIAFANALQMGSNAVRSVDPEAYVGIEGAQMPGWGGYDYARISPVLQAMEPYDIGNNVEIIRSFNPSLAFVTTAFSTGRWEKHRVWYELLHGARGQIIWDDKDDIVKPDRTEGERGREVAPYWNELRGGIAALLMNSTRQAGPIAIHYSQASMRTHWMLEQRPKGDAWMDRTSADERKNNDFLRLRDSYCKLIEDEGLQYNFVSYQGLETGDLAKGGYRVFILPASDSLSLAEARSVISFVREGGVLIVDGDAGTFDEHSRRLPESSLSQILNGDVGKGRVVRMNALDYGQQRVLGTEMEIHDDMAHVLASAGVRPTYGVTNHEGKSVVGLETHEFRNGAVTVIGLHNNPQQSVDELGPPELRSNRRFEKSQSVTLTTPAGQYAYNLRTGKLLGQGKQFPLTVDPYEPTLIAFAATPLPSLHIQCPSRIARGDIAAIAISLSAASPASMHVFHLEVRNPTGELIRYFSENLLAPNGSALKQIPIAKNEQTGQWTATVKDLLSGQVGQATFTIE